MKDLSGKERIILLILGVITVGTVCYSADNLLIKGVLSWHMKQKEAQAMVVEVVVLFGLMAIIFRMMRIVIGRVLAAGILIGAFLWAHMILVPVVVSGMYIGYLCFLGDWFLFRLLKKERESLCRGFLIGCMVIVCSFCLMSAVGIGQIPYLWLFVLATSVMMVLDKRFGRSWYGRVTLRSRLLTMGLRDALMVSLVLTILCIQAGRMNIGVDFDSLWYGVRSPYILDNGGGIYENMGSIGIVYTYSKGFEVLTLPLSILPSYSFGISYNLWLAVGILLLSYKIGRNYMEEDLCRVMTVFLAAVPGIMNMSITAKSDIATLFFQLIMVYEMIRCVKGDRQAFWYSLASFFFTWTLKPTALIFSTAVMGMSGVYLLKEKGLPRHRCREMAVTILSLVALAGIWGRTFLITGLPVTSVFSSVLTKLGFQMKYPFNVQKIPNSSQGLAITQWGKDMIKRIYGVLLNPQGEDMSHVILAWGGLGVWFLLWVWFVWMFLEKRHRGRREHQLDRYLHIMFLPFLVCNLISLLLLTQVDGNYFMLFYVLSAVYGFRFISRIKKKQIKLWICWYTAPVMVFSVMVMILTNWNWTLGFTPASWLHAGYYDHQKMKRQEMEETGNGSIWDILGEDSRNRLISIGDHPGTLLFPCNTQSYLDITGTWGNVVLVKYMDNFVEFMKYAKTDYVYAQAGYISEEERAWSLTCDLIEYGILVPVCYEQGNMLATVDTQGQWTEESAKALDTFKRLYRKKGE